MFVDPARIAELAEAGEGLAEIHQHAMAGELAPERAPALPEA
jgi:hypothetical protein